MPEEIRGKTTVKLFSNENNNFGIFKIKMKDGSFLTIKGAIAKLHLDREYLFHGAYVEDSRYGLQFNVSLFNEVLPSDDEMVIRYLSGPLFPGIGIKTAQKIVETYGTFIIEEIQKDPDFILEVEGLSLDRSQEIVNIIHEDNIENTNVNWLLSKGLSGNQIHILMNYYEEDVVNVLENNPFQPMYDVSGIGFKTLDKLSSVLNFDYDHPYRIEAVVLDLYKNKVFGNGDSYILENHFVSMLDEKNISGYSALLERQELILEDNRVYHYTQIESEQFVSSFICEFNYPQNEFILENIKDKLHSGSKALPIEYDDFQLDAIDLILKSSISVVTGGPGTGKSTLLSGLVTLLQSEMPWLSIALCAPTGRAAKRLENLTNVQATTIHSLIKWDLETNTFGHNKDNPIEVDVLIIDEFSMVDIWLLAKLFEALDKPKKIIFVGDKDQLPSVSSGFVLGDIINSGAVEIITLQKNYRQEAGSEVIDLALEVNGGTFDIEKYQKEVRFYPLKDMDIKHGVLQIVEKSLQQGYNLNDIQVLAPMYGGIAGIDVLNHFLQGYLNPPTSQKNEIVFGSKIFREEDKVLQLKNQPDDFVFNGDIGTIFSIEDGEVWVDFSGTEVCYGKADLINLNHAYCISVHKSQGSEYPIVILISSESFGRMLSRKLYYTGVSRSSRYLFILGQKSAFKSAVENNNEVRRKTTLKDRLMNKNHV